MTNETTVEAVAKALNWTQHAHVEWSNVPGLCAFCKERWPCNDSIVATALAALPEPATVRSVEHDVDYTSSSDEDGTIIYQCLHCGEAHDWGAIQDHVRAEHRPEPATVGGVTREQVVDIIQDEMGDFIGRYWTIADRVIALFTTPQSAKNVTREDYVQAARQGWNDPELRPRDGGFAATPPPAPSTVGTVEDDVAERASKYAADHFQLGDGQQTAFIRGALWQAERTPATTRALVQPVTPPRPPEGRAA